MKWPIVMVMTLSSLFFCSAMSCNKETDTPNDNITMSNEKIKITVGSNIFYATLVDNNTANAFKEQLPLTLNMIELNGNEKYADLPNSLPTNSYNPHNIENGDLMLYGSKTLVLFYKNFSTSYSYTKIGKFENITGLNAALGSGNVTVSFELE